MFKYPKTFHFSWSENLQNDDRMLASDDIFTGKEIVVTVKCDGENTSLYRDYYHARSLDSRHHPSRSWLKAFHAQFKDQIPVGWRVCGENLFATHSIHYTSLPSYFLVFSIWDENNVCLSWDATKEWAELLGLLTVPELYRGIWDVDKVKACYIGQSFGAEQEGYVVRNTASFHYDNFVDNVGKFVRFNHIKTDQNWMNQPVVPNGIIHA